jgi:hypothetical protein
MSTKTSLHHVEEAVENREVTLGASLDIEGAFNGTSFDIITEAAKQHCLGELSLCCVVGELELHLQEKLWRGLWPGAVHMFTFYQMCCAAWV